MGPTRASAAARAVSTIFEMVAVIARRLVGDGVGAIFGDGFSGFTARLTERRARRLAVHPLVEHVEQDRVVPHAAVRRNTPWGLDCVDERALPRSRAKVIRLTARKAVRIDD